MRPKQAAQIIWHDSSEFITSKKCLFLRYSVSKRLKEIIKSKLTCSSKLALTLRLYFDHFQNQFQIEQNYLFFTAW